MADPTQWPVGFKDSINDLMFLIATGQWALRQPFRPTDSAREGQSVLIRMLLTSDSLIQLLSVGSGDADKRRRIDPFSIASLVRDLVEAHNVLRYVYSERVSEAEEEFRIGLYGHHQSCERAKIGGLLNLPKKDKDETDSLFGGGWIDSINRWYLEGREVFQSLTPRQQKELLKGSNPYFRTERPEFKSILADPAFSRGMYKLLSNIVHAHPLATSMLRNVRAPQWPEYEGLIDVSISYGTLHAAEGIRGFISRRRLGVEAGGETRKRIRGIIRRHSNAFRPLIRREAAADASEND